MSKQERFRFIRQQVGRWSIAAMCRALQVSQQGYYQFLRRPDRAFRDRELLEEIYECLREEPENANYGVRRLSKTSLKMSATEPRGMCARG